jgi:hypothetical protein
LDVLLLLLPACKFDIDLSSVIEETARRAAVPARSPKTSESSEANFDKKRSNRYSETSDGGSSDSSGVDVRILFPEPNKKYFYTFSNLERLF